MAALAKGGASTRVLLGAVILMGVAIVLGVAFLGLTIVRRMGAPAAGVSDVALHEPAGTRMAGVAATGDRLVLLLQGGGADRLLLLDPRTGAVTAHVTLATP